MLHVSLIKVNLNLYRIIEKGTENVVVT